MPENPPGSEAGRSSANTLRIENQALAKGFTLIPNYILRAKGISRDAKMLYSILLSYAWQTDSCFPGYDRLMEDMQCAKEALAKYIKELKTSGLIEVQRRGQGMTSLYTLRDVEGDTIQKFDNRTSRSSDLKPLEVRKSNAKNTQGIKHKEEYSSNTRKGPRRLTAHTSAEVQQTGSLLRIRQDSLSAFDREPGDDVSHEAVVAEDAGEENIRAVRDMSPDKHRPEGFQAVGATILQRRAGRPSNDEAAARLVIKQYVEDYGRQLGDQAPKSSVTRALNLLHQSGVAVGLFINALQDTYKRTQQKSANIQKVHEGGASPYPQKNKMPYYFSLLEEELGLKEKSTVGK